MDENKSIFRLEEPARSSKIPQRVILIALGIALAVGAGVYFYSKRHVYAMERMGEKFRAEVEKVLDSNNPTIDSVKGLDHATNVMRASWVFAKEIEYSKGTAPPNPKDSAELARIRTLDELRSEIKASMLKTDKYIGGIDEDTYSSVLSLVLTPEELIHLEEIRKRYGYWQKIKSSLAK